MDPAYNLARNISQTRFHDLSEKTVQFTKHIILDSLGVALAGIHAKECTILTEMAWYWNGLSESTIIGQRQKVPSPMAALVNGTMIQALDFDETHDFSGAHTASCVLPAALALGEVKGATGKEFISAIALGIDLACRLGRACKEKIGWTSTSVYGCFGAAAAAAKILGLSDDKICHALGIVVSQAAGTTQTALDSPLSKHMQSGFASKAGVLSALLAEKGVTGVQNVFEGKYGFFNLYKSGRYNRDELLKDLGEHFEIDNLSLKPFPSCRATHGPIEGVASLIRNHGLTAEDISSIKITVSNVAFDLVGALFNPGNNPIVSAQFSIQFTVSAMVVYGKVSLDEFNLGTIHDPRIRSFAERIRIERDERIGPDGFVPVDIEIETKGGQRYFKTVEVLKGHPDYPMGDDELIDKFTKCVKLGSPKIQEGEIDRFIEMLMHLEKIDDVGEVTSLLRLKGVSYGSSVTV